jgi:HSP20 family protein
MYLTRSSGSVAGDRLRNELDRWFSGLFTGVPVGDIPALVARGSPAVNVWETEHDFQAELELPGFSLGDLDVSVVGNELTIKGERKGVEDDEAVYVRRERNVGSFSRVVRLPASTDSAKVAAHLKDGVLTIRLPKTEASKPRKIQVKALQG